MKSLKLYTLAALLAFLVAGPALAQDAIEPVLDSSTSSATTDAVASDTAVAPVKAKAKHAVKKKHKAKAKKHHKKAAASVAVSQ